MPKATSSRTIASLFRIRGRFQRSVQIDKDFHDPAALENYFIMPSTAEAFRRIADGLRPESGRRAWRITGDYGVGKSAFALVLAHLLARRDDQTISAIDRRLGWSETMGSASPVLHPILLTGSRNGLVEAIARNLASVDAGCAGRRSDGITKLADKVASSGSVPLLEKLIETVRNDLAKDGRGLLLVIDELGKHLEFAASNPESEDVFVLQRLAEIASRSGERPFVMIGLLHQGFQAYAERLPASARHEWDKIAGRFDEIVFDQPLADTAALVGDALSLDNASLPKAVQASFSKVTSSSAKSGWFGGAAGQGTAMAIDAADLYPLHPTLLPVLVRFFARFGQNERSLFGFLLSSEPFGLQDFAAREATPGNWYGIAEFYDYVRAMFGHRLAGGSYRSQWLRIVAIVDGAAERDPAEAQVLKVVAILNLLDADELMPTESSIIAAMTPRSASDVTEAVASLSKSGFLFQRGRGGAFRLWPNSSVSLEAALAEATRVMGPLRKVAPVIIEHLDREPVLARRHYVETGTMRYFDVRYVEAADLEASATLASDADGMILLALVDTKSERARAIRTATGEGFRGRPDILVGVGDPLSGLAGELQEVRLWQWVSENTPELVEDHFASAEVSRQLAAARRALAEKVAGCLGVRGGSRSAVNWFRGGKAVAGTTPVRGGVSGLLSDACDEIYRGAPLIANELLNRNVLSSAASAARMRLIEGIFEAGDKALLGIPADKNPPEKSMYLSVLMKGRVHVPNEDGHAVVEPIAIGDPDADRETDPLRLKPALDRILGLMVDAHGERVAVNSVLAALREAPLGVRAGVAPLLLAIILRTRSHEIAVYERGTFLHRFGPSDFLRLMKAPQFFEIQQCKVTGVRLEVFRKLSTIFAPAAGPGRGAADLLDIVRPLCQFAAGLPEFTRKARNLGGDAIAVRDALLSAKEPSGLLFRDLPSACGLDPRAMEEAGEERFAEVFVGRLTEATGELRGAYPELLDRIVTRVAEAAGMQRGTFDRASLANRAALVSNVAKEPRLRTFALRLRDPGLSDDAWAESLATFIISKPPARWAPGDEARFNEEVGALVDLFIKVEATAFPAQVREGQRNDGIQPDRSAIRINLTRGDGEDVFDFVRDNELAGPALDAGELVRHLPSDPAMRKRLLVELLWEELNKGRPDSQGIEASPDARTSGGIS
ncbi:ATP-binding protein [Aurantimonas litoralis]|nr:ATP-binding protein [Aurantimonas litoralis]